MEEQDKKIGGGLNINAPTAILLGAIIIAAAVIFSNGYKSNNGTKTAGTPANAVPQATEIIVAPITDKDHFYGNPNAKVVMIEFSDLECPFCKLFSPTVKKIVDESKGQVALVYRHFPIDSLHPKARKEAEAAECANELGGNDKFWEYVDGIFAITPSNNKLDPAELPKIATQIGLNTSKFKTCLMSGKYKDKVEAQYQDGLKVGVNGTPTTVLINTKGKKLLIVGAESEERVKAAIDTLIK